MRKFCRTDEPDCLKEKAAILTEKFVAARKENPSARFNWPNGGYETIRSKLLEMTQYHCAFCDGPFSESRETVEHFRPKSRFPELAYRWENLFPCCDACQSAKGEKFDELLLKPDEQEYIFSGYFIVNFRTGAIEALPSAEAVRQSRAQVSIDMYDLNRKARLIARQRELECYLRAENPCIDDFNYRYFLEDSELNR
ncbi:MAG TPA: retron system putative HNH endonuclease [Noviherbaspirillum sp.]